MTKASSAVLIDQQTTEAKPYEVRAEILAEGSPRQCLWQGLSLSEGAVNAGFWEGEGCILTIGAYPHHEIFMVTEGQIRLETENTTVDVGPGQSAYVPKDWAGRWHTIGKTRKHYVIFKDLAE